MTPSGVISGYLLLRNERKGRLNVRRKQNFQNIAWFWDLHTRDLLDLDPPYQRRSVWNQVYKDYFIDTILLGYPAPAIFLFEEIDPSGRVAYHVVDGKQRLLTLFEFASDQFSVPANATTTELRDRYFNDLPDEVKRDFWGYPFSVEYIPTDNEAIIDNVFDRINRNTAKLTAQELRHARYSGEFITLAEDLSAWLVTNLTQSFPNIAPRSRRQMKDVELAAHLLLMLERGVRGYSTSELDAEFSARDAHWEQSTDVDRRFRRVVGVLLEMVCSPEGEALQKSRLRNQADFYSLFGAIDKLLQDGHEPDPDAWATRCSAFAARADDEEERAKYANVRDYYEAARSASNDTGPRQTRVAILAQVLGDDPLDGTAQ